MTNEPINPEIHLGADALFRMADEYRLTRCSDDLAMEEIQILIARRDFLQRWVLALDRNYRREMAMGRLERAASWRESADREQASVDAVSAELAGLMETAAEALRLKVKTAGEFAKRTK
jgi:hypothetical protein